MDKKHSKKKEGGKLSTLPKSNNQFGGGRNIYEIPNRDLNNIENLDELIQQENENREKDCFFKEKIEKFVLKKKLLIFKIEYSNLGRKLIEEEIIRIANDKECLSLIEKLKNYDKIFSDKS